MAGLGPQLSENIKSSMATKAFLFTLTPYNTIYFHSTQNKQTLYIGYLFIYFNHCDVTVDGNVAAVRMRDSKFGRSIFFSSFINMAAMISGEDRAVTTRAAQLKA